MKKFKVALLISTSLLTVSAVNAQNVRIGNTTSGVTASGNTIAIGNGNGSVQINNIPAVAAGALSAVQQMKGSAGTTDTSTLKPENMAQIESAQSNFLKQKEDAAKAVTQTAAQNAIKNQNDYTSARQEKVQVGQDLRTLKSNLVTDNIAFYNKTTINQIEGKAKEENPKMYYKFPEYIVKNY